WPLAGTDDKLPACRTSPRHFHRSQDSSVTGLLTPYLVGMTRVLVDASAIFRKSPGPPRLTPSIQLPAPRSSTHRPQLTHASNGLSLPISSSAATKFFVVGWSSSSIEVPLTGLACGA